MTAITKADSINEGEANKDDKKRDPGGGKDADVKSSGQQREQGLPHATESLSNRSKQMHSSGGSFAMGGRSSCR